MSAEGREEGSSHPHPRRPPSASTAPPAHRRTRRGEGRGSPQNPPCGAAQGERIPAGTAAPGVQDEPPAEGRRELADPAVTKRSRSRCSSACSRRTRQLFAAGGGRQMPSSRSLPAHIWGERGAPVRLLASRLARMNLAAFPHSTPQPPPAASPAHTLPSPAPFPTSPGMPLRSRPLSGQEGAGRLGAGARQSKGQKSPQPPLGGEVAASL